MELKNMKAMVREVYGNADVIQIEEIRKPEVNSNELLIKIHATTVNRTDCAILTGKPWIMRFSLGFFSPKEKTTGTDFSGRVVAVGDDVMGFKVGDRVFGFNDTGVKSHAEYIAINEDQPISLIPEKLSYEEAVTALEGVHYAYNFINKVDIKNSDEILINGAAGAIGSALVQLLKYYGVTITAVCSTRHIELMKSLGINNIIDYKKEDFTTKDKKYDYIFDAVGKSSFKKCKPLLKENGIYISSEPGEHFRNLFLAVFSPLLGGKKVIFPLPSDIKGSINFVKQLIKDNQYKAIIDRKYTLDTIDEAYRYVLSGHKSGNVLITFE